MHCWKIIAIIIEPGFLNWWFCFSIFTAQRQQWGTCAPETSHKDVGSKNERDGEMWQHWRITSYIVMPWALNRDYSMEKACMQFLFRSWVVSENEWASSANEWVSWSIKLNKWIKIVQSIFHGVICLFYRYWDCWKANFCQYYARLGTPFNCNVWVYN